MSFCRIFSCIILESYHDNLGWNIFYSKVLGPYPFFPTVQPGPQPRIDFPYYEISGPDICSLICVAVYSNNGDLKSLISPRFNLWHTYYYIWSMYLLLKTRQHPSCAHSGKNFLFCITSNNNLFNQILIRSESYDCWNAVWDLISYSIKEGAC